MDIGVKFCGGCNPRYDRGSIFNKLKVDLNYGNLMLAEEGQEYDFLIILGGCTNCCADYSNIFYRKDIILFMDISMYESTINLLKKTIKI